MLLKKKIHVSMVLFIVNKDFRNLKEATTKFKVEGIQPDKVRQEFVPRTMGLTIATIIIKEGIDFTNQKWSAVIAIIVITEVQLIDLNMSNQ